MSSAIDTRGYTLVVSVMIIAAIMLGIAAAASRTLLSEHGSSVNFEISQQAQRLAEGCVDQAMVRLRDNPDYGGNEVVAFAGGTCTIQPIVFASPNVLTVSSTVSNRTYRLQVKFTSPPPTIVEWVRIP